MAQRRYKLYGRVVASPIDLPGIPRTGDDAVDWTVVSASDDPAANRRTEWFHTLDSADDVPPMRFGMLSAGRYVVVTEAESSFTVDLGLRRIEAWGLGRSDRVTAVHQICDQIVPLALASAGDFVLHASAVTRGGVVLAFAGPSGSGKSSLAAALVKRGWGFLTDDALRLELGEEIRAWPGYPSVRLWPDSIEGIDLGGRAAEAVRSGSEKQRLAMEPAPGGAVRLARLLLLDGGNHGTVELGEPPLREAIVHLARCTFRLDFRDSRVMASEFRAAEGLIASGKTGQLRYPRRFDALDDVAAFLASLLGDAPNPELQ